MPKLLWVLLPLLAALAVLAWQRLHRRRTSRLGLNVGFSLLLLAYVATTAGLGIFWVAKQQLPVFDWHYLFGYATLALLVLHLVFNLPTVWRYLRRPRGRASVRAPHVTAATPAAAAAQRRRGLAMGVVGAASIGGVAYWLGLRHGRDDVAPRAALPASAADAGAAAAAAATSRAEALAQLERFHALSSNRRAGVLLQAPGVDWGDVPPPFKRYARAPRIALPTATHTTRGAAPASLDLAALASVLWHTVGVTAKRGSLRLRAAPSSGALFATELYVAARAVGDLAPGWWHYDAQQHALSQLSATPAHTLAALTAHAAAQGAAALVVATAVFRRSGHKYRDRTYRYVLADLGHALQNLRVAARAMGVACRFVPRFDEADFAAALGIDKADEGVLALLALGPPEADAQPPAAAWSPAAAPATSKLGITGAMHAATSLRRLPGAAGAAGAVSAPALPQVVAAAADRRAASSAALALPVSAPSLADPLRTIALRRSVRRFAAQAVPQDALSAVLAALGAADALSPAVRIDVVINQVAGLAPGAYRYLPQAHRLLPRRPGIDLRGAAFAAALHQDVIGDAAAVFVLSLDRATLAADALGPLRGYRHALLEAGCVGERIYLEVGARGLGCCAVGAFFDDEASALVGADPAREWVLHFAALGVPA